MTVTKEFAVKIDTELSSWHDKRWTVSYKIEDAQDSIKFYEKHYPNRVEEIQKHKDKVAELSKEYAQIKLEIARLDAIYDQDPWTRAFLVINSNGHVHSSMDCNTCFATTRYQWLIQYSNDDEKTIVEDAGQDACTICYPSAPAEVLNRPSRIVTEDKVAKAKAKAERDAKREAKIAKEKANAPTKSGEFLYFKQGRYTQVIKTERTAVSEWLNNQYWILNSSNPESQESKKQVNEIICQNLAEKNGVSFDQQLKILENKYKKRGNR
jgi:hypothetical protein